VSEPSSASAARGTEYAVALPTFEGPLDLLLHLCQKHELDILEIPIGFVTEKYLEYLALMQLMQLDVASEYLVMAATLAHIKSKSLLPSPPPGQEDDALDPEDEEDPREALIRRLLEYQKYKQAGADLAARGVAGRDVFLRGAGAPSSESGGAPSARAALPPLAEVPLYAIVEAFQRVLERSKVKLTHEVVTERVSLNDRIQELADVLRARQRVVFEELFDGLSSQIDLVITFLALLEMTRLRMTRLFQTEPLAPLYVEVPLATDDRAMTDETTTIEATAPGASPADDAAIGAAEEGTPT
jgi:segregation and condensation protein A